MKSGMLAAEAAFDALTGSSSAAADLAAYEDSMQSSWVWEELTKERNIRPSYVPLYLCRPELPDPSESKYSLKTRWQNFGGPLHDAAHLWTSSGASLTPAVLS